MMEKVKCGSCNAYREGVSFFHCLIPKVVPGRYTEGWDCWHPIGTAKVWHEELERQAEGTQEAQQEAIP